MQRPGLAKFPPWLKLEGVIQHYGWGGHDFIPRLIGVPNPERRPFAELWIGAHPQAPSTVRIAGSSLPLDRLIAESPEAALGPAARARFGARLPYLFKVLDVDKMLSIQAHPNRMQAKKGFARENAAGIPLDAANRSYKDEGAKPEVHVALTDFWMLHGFRPLEQIAGMFASTPELALLMPSFSAELAHIGAEPQARPRLLRELYVRVMTMPQQHVDNILNPLLARLATEKPEDRDRPEYWAMHAAAGFPLPAGHRDRGIFSIFLLNLLHLRPGQGTYQPAGLLHAYLEGVTVELMANSDNILRGGLTPKHVDVPELLEILSFESHVPGVIEGERIRDGERVYRTPAEEFELSRIDLVPGAEFRADAANGPEAILLLQGAATLAEGNEIAPLGQGSLVFVRFGTRYRLAASSGPVIAFKAALPALPFLQFIKGSKPPA